MRYYITILLTILLTWSQLLLAQTSGKPFKASFVYAVNNKVSPLTYNFTNNSTSKNTIVKWKWSFGDGETSSRKNTEHQYLSSGVYIVSLTIVDNKGNTNKTTQSIKILEAIPPSCNAFFTFIRDTSAPDFTYNFTDHSTCTDVGDSIVNWIWNFGDSSPLSHLQHPSHKYISTGSYNVSLKIITVKGTVSSYNYTIIITNGTVICDANYTYSSDTNTGAVNKIIFHDNSLHIDPIISWSWNFSDGDSSNLQDPTHQFPYAGIYKVRLKIKTINCSSEITIPVQVGNPKNYHLWGRVYVGNLTTDKCVAYLYKKFYNNYIVPVDTVKLTSVNDTLGIYYFYQIPEGNHFVNVRLPNSSQYSDNFAPTYYGNKVLWDKSQNVALFSDKSNKHIHMKPVVLQSGSNHIKGTVTNNANGQIKDVLALLYNQQGDIVDYTFTDVYGNYHFDNVASGTHYVHGELTGFVSYPAYTNSLTNNDTVNINFIIKKGISIGFVDENKKKKKIDCRIYPNPMRDNTLFLEFKNDKHKEYNYQIINTLGSVMQESKLIAGKKRYGIILNSLQHGVYLISVKDNQGNTLIVKKFVR